MKNLFYTRYPLSIKSLYHLLSQFYNKKSPTRAFHNFFLRNIFLKGKTIDLGSGNHSSYLNFIKSKKVIFYYADTKISNKKNFIKVNLEKKLTIKSSSFENVLLFNVLEHIVNYKSLIEEINRILKKGGKLEIYVPFMHRYHKDPEDIFRPTHFYLKKILEDSGFHVKTYTIGTGPFSVFAEMINNYLKFFPIKFIVTFSFLLLDRIISLFSKDFDTFYNGVHCSCKKKK
tara:strand:- start:23050 stop:23739 length:690 start_codon:yes stop_codon:yes gene_type:complete